MIRKFPGVVNPMPGQVFPNRIIPGVLPRVRPVVRMMPKQIKKIMFV